MSDDFNFETTLGEGAFGKVYLVSRNSDGKKYAMKVIDLRTSPEEEKELAVKEANLLKSLQHEHVLAYTDSFDHDGALCIVTEYCAQGDLSVYLEKRGSNKLEEDRLTEWFRQIASALKYLHSKNIVHRDIKTPNIFLTEKWDTKLGDMGLAKVLERPNAKAITFCGSPYYMSPEIFSCKPYDSKSDIWALGVIVYEMATLERPFDANLMHQLVFKIVHGGLPAMPTGYNPELKQLLSDIMQKEPDQRPTADQILKHKFFTAGAKPKLPPRPPCLDSVGGAMGGSDRWAYIKRPDPAKKKGGGAAGPFDMKTLLDSLSTHRKKDDDKRAARGAVGGGDRTVKGMANILAKTHISPNKDIKFSKTVKKDVTLKAAPQSPPVQPSGAQAQAQASVVSVSDIEFDETLKEFQKETAGNAFNVMQMIVRTMTGVFPHEDPKEKEEAFKRSRDPMAVMLRQIEHLQYYCTKVLNNDVELFQKAYDLLGKEKDETKLEENLIKALGPEKFGLCGVQLMFLKNFEYNLEKLR